MAGIFCCYCIGVLAIALISTVRTAHLHGSFEEHCAQLSHHLDHLHLEEQKLGWAPNYGRPNISFASKSSVSEITLNDKAKIEFVPCLTCPLKGNPSMPLTEAQMQQVKRPCGHGHSQPSARSPTSISWSQGGTSHSKPLTFTGVLVSWVSDAQSATIVLPTRELVTLPWLNFNFTARPYPKPRWSLLKPSTTPSFPWMTLKRSHWQQKVGRDLRLVKFCRALRKVSALTNQPPESPLWT